MQTNYAAQAAREAIQKRITFLKDFIGTNANSDEAVLYTAVQLICIGTKEASDAVMDLIKQRRDTLARDLLIMILVTCSPFRYDYKEQLEQITEGSCSPDIDGVYADVTEDMANFFGQPPLWQEVAEVLKAELADKKHGPVLFQG